MNFWTFLSTESQQVGVGSLPYKGSTRWFKVYANLWSSVPTWSLANPARTSPKLRKSGKLGEGNVRPKFRQRLRLLPPPLQLSSST
eukprot:6147735-Ditylum_brightwellii.AAC.1